MPRPSPDWLTQNLQALLQTAPDLDALALVNMDGREIASVISQEVNVARLSAMSLAIFSLGEQIVSDFHRYQLEEIYIRGKHGFIVIMQIDKQAILVTLAREDARPGLILLELRRIANHLLEKKHEIQKKPRTAKK